MSQAMRSVRSSHHEGKEKTEETDQNRIHDNDGAIALCRIVVGSELMLRVLSFLGESCLLVVGCLNKRFHHLVSYGVDWEGAFLRRFPNPSVIGLARSQVIPLSTTTTSNSDEVDQRQNRERDSDSDDLPMPMLSIAEQESSLPAALFQRRLWKRQFVVQMKRSRYRKLSNRPVREPPGRHVYTAFDEREGREVAWHDIDPNFSIWQQRHEICGQLRLIRRLHHPCILQIFDFWTNPSPSSPSTSPSSPSSPSVPPTQPPPPPPQQQQKAGSFVVITELANSGTLDEFLNKNYPNRKSLKMRLVRRWCHQILRGLSYLHSPFQRVRKPPNDATVDLSIFTPIEKKPRWIHGNLSCACIFIDAMRGEARIGDIGMSLFVTPPSSSSLSSDCIVRNQSCDIRSVGLMTLEILMGDSSKQLQPTSDFIARIADPSVASFLDDCLNRPQECTANDLLNHAFFALDNAGRINEHGHPMSIINVSPSHSPSVDSTCVADILHPSGSVDSSANNSPSSKEPRPPIQTVPVDLLVKIRDAFQQISFEFQCSQDTPESVAREIVLNCIHSSDDLHDDDQDDDEVLDVEVDLLAGEIRRQVNKKLGGAASPSAPSTPRGSSHGGFESE